MWTNENRARYDRSGLRYPSDLTDAEWELVSPLIPPAKRGGGKRKVDMRQVVNGLTHVLSTGCQWRAIPKDLPPRSTVYGYFDLWTYDGTIDRLHHALYVKCREAAGREASPTAAVIDSQSVKAAEKGALYRSARLRRGQKDQRQEAAYSRRYDRPAAACNRCIPPTSRIGTAAFSFCAHCSGSFRFCKSYSPMAAIRDLIFRKAQKKALPGLVTEIIKRSDTAKGFEVLPRRWVVERTFSWLGRCRRLAKDWECLNRKGARFSAHRIHPAHAQQAMHSRMMSSDYNF